MKKHIKTITAGIGTLAACGCAVFGFAGCAIDTRTPSERLNAMAKEMALLMMGDDIFNWNAFAVSPSKSFGYSRYGQPSWYSYSDLDESEFDTVVDAFKSYRKMLYKIDINDLSTVDAAAYRSIDRVLDTYISYYSSPFAAEFNLMSGGYISADGGYVSTFALSFENFELRSERDVKDLITVTKSTGAAFDSYIDYAEARERASLPLYDYTITAMQDYLDAVTDEGSSYYLFDVARSKVDNAEFLPESVKTTYKKQLVDAIGNTFMPAVKRLSDGLEEYKGNVPVTNRSYLSAYGAAGRAYYEWAFKQKTGAGDVSISNVFNTVLTAYRKALGAADDVLDEAEELEATEPEVYAEFDALMSGESALLGLETPEEVLAYLKTAAKNIVPDLKTEPTIEFKYMDETAAQRSNTLAYYMSTPLDALDATEHITINGVNLEKSDTDLLPLLAHEGYPGHLYAYVNAKENGTKLISAVTGCLAFSEGWAQYTALSVLNNIAETSTNKAEQLYAKYSMYSMYSNYLSSTLFDIQVNYMGVTVMDYVSSDVTEDDARELIESFMEDPALYVPYGYGMYVVTDLHNTAKTALGENYSAPEFNGKLLADGASPSLKRAKEITDEYIKTKRA